MTTPVPLDPGMSTAASERMTEELEHGLRGEARTDGAAIAALAPHPDDGQVAHRADQTPVRAADAIDRLRVMQHSEDAALSTFTRDRLATAKELKEWSPAAPLPLCVEATGRRWVEPLAIGVFLGLDGAVIYHPVAQLSLSGTGLNPGALTLTVVVAVLAGAAGHMRAHWLTRLHGVPRERAPERRRLTASANGATLLILTVCAFAMVARIAAASFDSKSYLSPSTLGYALVQVAIAAGLMLVPLWFEGKRADREQAAVQRTLAAVETEHAEAEAARPVVDGVHERQIVRLENCRALVATELLTAVAKEHPDALMADAHRARISLIRPDGTLAERPADQQSEQARETAAEDTQGGSRPAEPDPAPPGPKPVATTNYDGDAAALFRDILGHRDEDEDAA